MMRVLPHRVYAVQSELRKQLLPHGTAHPAKMSIALQRDLLWRYTQPGQTLLDPFAGIGGLLLGLSMPDGARDVILCELEAKFCNWALENAAYLRYEWERRGQLQLPFGHAVIVQCDSRQLPLCTADACITSPAYAAAMQSGETVDAAAVSDREVRYRVAHPTIDRPTWEIYGSNPRNLGNLPRGRIDAVCTSPVYGRAITQGGETGTWQAGYGYQGRNAGYSRDKRNIGNLPEAEVSAVVTSPFYGDSNLEDLSGISGTGRGHLLPEERNRRAQGYDGQDNRQRWRHSRSDVSAAVGSPPYGNVFSDWDTTSKDLQGSGSGYADERGADAKRNIGNIPYYDEVLDTKRSPKPPEGKETYAAAVLQVYRECLRVVQPGGLLVLVISDYVRDRQVVPLVEDMVGLAVAAGWTPVERWRALKTRVSFWRILHQQRAAREGRATPLIAEEHVLVFCKGACAGWEFRELHPTARRPFVLRQQIATPTQLPLV